MGEALARLGYRWFEEPVPDRDISLLEQLTRRLEVPILATETVSLRELPQFLERKAVDLARGDVLIKAGITGLRKALAMCDQVGMNLEIHALHSSLLDIANLHVACSVRNCEFFELHHPMFRFAPSSESNQQATGCHIPTTMRPADRAACAWRTSKVRKVVDSPERRAAAT